MREVVELAVADGVDVGAAMGLACASGMMEFSGMRLGPRVMCVEIETPTGPVTLGEVFAVLAVVVDAEGAGAGAGDWRSCKRIWAAVCAWTNGASKRLAARAAPTIERFTPSLC